MSGHMKGKSDDLETITDANKSVVKAKADDFSIDGSIDELKYTGGSFITNSFFSFKVKVIILFLNMKEQTWIKLAFRIIPVEFATWMPQVSV